MKLDFENFYNTINSSELKDTWENAKKETSRKNKISIVTIIVIDILIIYYFINKTNFFINNIGYVSYIFGIVLLLIIDLIIYTILNIGFSKNNGIYNKQFKEIIIDKLFKNFFSDADYIPKKSMPEIIYMEGQYEADYNEYYSDDYMEATIENKYPIKMAEVTTKKFEEVKDKDGNTETKETILFSGLFAVINMKKSINNELKIVPNSIISLKEKLNMDSQEFEKYFDVYSTDKIIGMQLLTHDIMDLLVDLKRQFGKQFDIVIKNNTMYIRLHVGNMFEAKVNKKEVVDKSILNKYFNVLEYIDLLSKEMIKVVEETQI